MKTKLFFRDDDEFCHTLGVHIKHMEENGIKEMDVFEAKVEYGTGFFFCKEFYQVGESGEGCGKFCDKYIPNNGKNGKCKHHRNVYEQTDKVLKIKITD